MTAAMRKLKYAKHTMACATTPIKFQLRRDTAANWLATNPVLKAGEPGVETDTGQMKVGDGIHTWRQLPYVGANGQGPTGATGPTGAAGPSGVPEWQVGSDSSPGQFRDESIVSGETGFLFNPVDDSGVNRDGFFGLILNAFSTNKVLFTVYKSIDSYATVQVSHIEVNHVTAGSWWVSGPVLYESAGFNLFSGGYSASYTIVGNPGPTGPTGPIAPSLIFDGGYPGISYMGGPVFDAGGVM